jgi:hypothetical protein
LEISVSPSDTTCNGLAIMLGSTLPIAGKVGFKAHLDRVDTASIVLESYMYMKATRPVYFCHTSKV